MRPDGIPIQTLLLRVFLPAVAVVAIGLGVLTYNRLYATILDGFERKLATVSALTGALVDPDDHDKLIAIARTEPESDEAERSPEYLRAVEPMRRIREKLGVTYLYTQILGGEQDIIYVLDGTKGKDHSPIGSEDDLPDETLAGIKQVEARGGVHLSPIEYQQQWGLLKTASAPVRDGKGRIVATAGADVNVSLIQTATQNALFTSVVIGMLSLLICTLAVLIIVRKVAEPLDRLRQEALRIAGGDHRPLDAFPAPSDIASLRGALADSTSALTGRLAARRAEAQAAIAQAGTAALDAELARIAAGASHLDFSGPEPADTDALLRRAAAAILAERIAADPSLAETNPLLILAEGESAMAKLPDGRSVSIGTAP
jgi:hypothetical protein